MEQFTGQRTKKLTAIATVALVVCSVLFGKGSYPATAQGAAVTCAQLLPKVQQNLATSCQGIDRDQLCMGYQNVSVQLKDGVAASSFQKVGDTVPLASVKSISTAPLDLDKNTWGLVVLKLQANLPNTSSGQVVTFVLYGSTTLSNAGAAGAATKPAATCSGILTRATNLAAQPGAGQQNLKALTPNTEVKVSARLADQTWVYVESAGTFGWLPARNLKIGCEVGTLPTVNPNVPAVLADMGSFYFTADTAAQAQCKDIPAGLMVQSPTGSKVQFQVNGVNMTIGSTVVLRAEAKKKMQVAVLKGQAILRAQGKTEVVNKGKESSVPLGGDDGLTAAGPPETPQEITDPTLDAQTACLVADSVDGGNLCSSAPDEISTGEGLSGSGDTQDNSGGTGNEQNPESGGANTGQDTQGSSGEKPGNNSNEKMAKTSKTVGAVATVVPVATREAGVSTGGF